MPKKLTKKQREDRAQKKADRQLNSVGKTFYKQMDVIHKRSNAATQKIHRRRQEEEKELEERFSKKRERILNAYRKATGKK